jgi:hypothetical protein
MTRKDYQMLSKHLNDLYQDLNINAQLGEIDFDRFMSRLCSSLKRDNENFDSAKFREKVYHG